MIAGCIAMLIGRAEGFVVAHRPDFGRKWGIETADFGRWAESWSMLEMGITHLNFPKVAGRDSSDSYMDLEEK